MGTKEVDVPITMIGYLQRKKKSSFLESDFTRERKEGIAQKKKKISMR